MNFVNYAGTDYVVIVVCAVHSDVRTIPAFRDRLLVQNGNKHVAAVNELFRYGY